MAFARVMDQALWNAKNEKFQLVQRSERLKWRLINGIVTSTRRRQSVLRVYLKQSFLKMAEI